MILAVISDVHANRHALAAVLAAIEGVGVEGLVCLGDLVGYNADPDACAQAVLGRAALTVRGNHDKAVAGLMPLAWFSPVAAEAARWTRQVTSRETVERLASLPPGPREAAPGVLACHGAPHDEDAYIVTPGDAARAFSCLEEDHPQAWVCLHGHTHVPLVVEWRAGRAQTVTGATIRLNASRRYLLNPGSVGQPRDGNPRASFGILDVDHGRWRIVRVAYDVEGAQARIAAARLPAELAERLAAGW